MRLLIFFLLSLPLAAQVASPDIAVLFGGKRGLVRGGLAAGFNMTGGVDTQSIASLPPGTATITRGANTGASTDDPTVYPLFWHFDVSDLVSGVPALASDYTIMTVEGWPNPHVRAYTSAGLGYLNGAVNPRVWVRQPTAVTRGYSTMSWYGQWSRVLNPREQRLSAEYLRSTLNLRQYDRVPGLMDIGHYGTNQPAIRLDWTGGGTATVDWGDGSAAQNLVSGSAVTKTAAYGGGVHRMRLTWPSDAAVTYYDGGNMQMTGALPDISGLTNLETWYSYINQHTGPLPDISGLTKLVTWASHANQHTGPLPDISGLTNLVNWASSTNQHTGPLPDISGLTKLVTWYSHANQHTGRVATGIGSRKLTTFHVYNNLLTVADVNSILADLVVAQAGGNPVCNVHLGGMGNAAPTGQGLTDKATLIAAGWTVVTN